LEYLITKIYKNINFQTLHTCSHHAHYSIQN
jgi:hypothetical protein